MHNARQQRRFQKRLQAMASVIGRRSDIQHVLQDHFAPATDFQRVFLPKGNLEDPSYRRLVEGLCDHEHGHLAFTDQHCAMGESRLVFSLLNRIEDVRMENAVAAKFPGCAKTLGNTISECIEREIFAMPRPEASVPELVINYVLYHGRSAYQKHGYPLTHIAEATRELLLQAGAGELVDLIEGAMSAIPNLKSTRDALDVARQIADELEHKANEPPPPSSNDSTGDDESDSGDDSTGDDESDSGDDSTGDDESDSGDSSTGDDESDSGDDSTGDDESDSGDSSTGDDESDSGD
ncbi:hypothetical protein IC617_08005, partial [Neiella sp. HB171785]